MIEDSNHSLVSENDFTFGETKSSDQRSSPCATPMFENSIHIAQSEKDNLDYNCDIGGCKHRAVGVRELEKHLYHCISENLGIYVTRLRASYLRFEGCIHVRFEYSEYALEESSARFHYFG